MTNDRAGHAETGKRLVDLSHELVPGEQAYDWLPAPEMSEYLSREESRKRYRDGTAFVIHQISFIGNSGTYLDAPIHRHEDGVDLAELPLERIADLPGVVIDVRGARRREIDHSHEELCRAPLHRRAVLFCTGWDHHWATADYPVGAPFVGRGLAELLAEKGAALVGIDAMNIDNMDDPTRPAHTILLGAGIPIVESLCNLDQLPNDGFRFTAVPVRVRGGSSFPVRAFAVA